MNSTVLYNNFYFNKYDRKKYNYSDNRKGSPLNFLACMLKGECRIVSSENTIEVKEGGIFYIPKGLPYESFWYGYDDISFLSFGFDRLDTSDNTRLKLQNIECSEELHNRIVNLAVNDTSCKTLAEFYSIMAELLPIMEQKEAKRDELLIKEAINFLRFHTECSVPDIAKAIHISEPYVYVLFKKHLDTTPNEYRQKLICEKGRQLLLSTNKTVEEISELLKISSASYFRKLLKKHIGLTPREIRRERIF